MKVEMLEWEGKKETNSMGTESPKSTLFKIFKMVNFMEERETTPGKGRG